MSEVIDEVVEERNILLWKEAEQRNQHKTRIAIQKFIAEMEKEDPSWVKERRIAYCEAKIEKLSEEIRGIYGWYEDATERDIDYLIKLIVLGITQLRAKEKLLEKWASKLRWYKFGNEITKSKITDEMITIAKEYPIEELLEVKRNFALCLWHDDHHPSLYVKSNFGYCFVCGKVCDTIDLVMKRDGINFVEAVKVLCGSASRAIKGGRNVRKGLRSTIDSPETNRVELKTPEKDGKQSKGKQAETCEDKGGYRDVKQ
jgi:hypothetical protein